MAAAYIFATVTIIASHLDQLLPALKSVFSGAFTGTAAMEVSAEQRSKKHPKRWAWVFSNESNPIRPNCSSSEEDQWFSGLLICRQEPFIDTIITCSLTGFSLLVSEWMAKALVPDSGYVCRRLWSSRRHHSDPMLGAFCDHDHTWMVLLRRAVFRILLASNISTSIGPSLFYGWTRRLP